MEWTLEEKRYHAWQLRKIIELTMNRKDSSNDTIQNRENTLNQMWKLVIQYERENGIR